MTNDPEPTTKSSGSPWLSAGYLRRHCMAMAAGCLLMIAANAMTGAPWWAIWPVAIWIVVLLIHLMIYRSLNADERWVDRRIRKIRARSYDFGHIGQIENSYAGQGWRKQTPAMNKPRSLVAENSNSDDPKNETEH